LLSPQPAKTVKARLKPINLIALRDVM